MRYGVWESNAEVLNQVYFAKELSQPAPGLYLLRYLENL